MFQKISAFFVIAIGKIHWRLSDPIPENELDTIRKLLKKDYYIILTRRRNHLSTYFVSLANLFLTGKLGYWAHALMNLEDEVNKDTDFRLVEAIGTGVQYTPFEGVFDVNSTVLLKPKSMTIEKWTAVFDKAKTEIGKPYDTLFDIKNDNALSCVELVRTVLQAEPNYEIDFADFERMIAREENLTPDMFYACSDFEVAFEIRH